MTPLIAYVKDNVSTRELKETKKLQEKASRYTILDDRLYQRGFSFSLLKCITTQEADYVIKEVHEGVCGTLIGGRALTTKIA